MNWQYLIILGNFKQLSIGIFVQIGLNASIFACQKERYIWEYVNAILYWSNSSIISYMSIRPGQCKNNLQIHLSCPLGAYFLNKIKVWTIIQINLFLANPFSTWHFLIYYVKFSFCYSLWNTCAVFLLNHVSFQNPNLIHLNK